MTVCRLSSWAWFSHMRILLAIQQTSSVLTQVPLRADGVMLLKYIHIVYTYSIYIYALLTWHGCCLSLCITSGIAEYITRPCLENFFETCTSLR